MALQTNYHVLLWRHSSTQILYMAVQCDARQEASLSGKRERKDSKGLVKDFLAIPVAAFAKVRADQDLGSN